MINEMLNQLNEQVSKIAKQNANLIAEIEQLKKVLKEIIDISDRKHDAWDKAKELLQKASEK